MSVADTGSRAAPRPRAGAVTWLQHALVLVGWAVIALVVAVLFGAGHGAVVVLEVLCGLELLVCVAVVVEALVRRDSRRAAPG